MLDFHLISVTAGPWMMMEASNRRSGIDYGRVRNIIISFCDIITRLYFNPDDSFALRTL